MEGVEPFISMTDPAKHQKLKVEYKAYFLGFDEIFANNFPSKISSFTSAYLNWQT